MSNQQNSPDKVLEFEQRKTLAEQKEVIETYAAAVVAQEQYDKQVTHRSMDEAGGGNTADTPSFMRLKEESFQKDYGINNEVANKWASKLNKTRSTPRKPFDSDNASEDAEDDKYKKDAMSDTDLVTKGSKRNNLIQLFLKGTEVDNYIINNMYGRNQQKFVDNNNDESFGEMTLLDNLNADETFTHQIRLLHEQSFAFQQRDGETKVDKPRKMNAFETYIALIKGYCALMILVLPRSFANGGYIFSPMALIISGYIQCISALKLVECAKKTGIKSYSLITANILGARAKKLLDFMIFGTQFSFSLSLISFITTAVRSIIETFLGVTVPAEIIGAALCCILVPIAWVRNISRFSFTFLIGNTLILTTVIIVSYVLLHKFFSRGMTFGPEIEPINTTSYWSMVGFSCYAYEGIGVVMPIMSACECPENFGKILFYAILTLTIVYCSFADLCYLILGSDLDKVFITQQLDQKSVVVIVLQIIYSLNLVCSYAIMIFPANTIVEDYALRSLSKKKDETSKKMYYYLQNVSRMMVCFAATYCAVVLEEKLDKFLSVLGALLCAPLAILYPALLHLKGVAKTNQQKWIDIFLIVIAIIILIFSTEQSIAAW